MKVPKNWMAALAVAVSFPSMIITIGWFSMKLSEADIVSKKTADIIFIVRTTLFLGLMVWYGIKRKN